jgi:hypothetical protein
MFVYEEQLHVATVRLSEHIVFAGDLFPLVRVMTSFYLNLQEKFRLDKYISIIYI